VNLAELLADLERRATEAEVIHATAPVKDVIRTLIQEVRELDNTPAVARKDRLISVAEAAARLSVSTRYIYTHKNELPYVRLSGGAVRCSEFAVEREIKKLRLAS